MCKDFASGRSVSGIQTEEGGQERSPSIREKGEPGANDSARGL